MRGAAYGQSSKLFSNLFLMEHEARGVEIIVIIEQLDKSLQFVCKQQGSKLFAIGFLNVDKRVPAVEMRDDEVTDWRKPKGLSEILRIPKIDKGPAVLLNRKYFDGS